MTLYLRVWLWITPLLILSVAIPSIYAYQTAAAAYELQSRELLEFKREYLFRALLEDYDALLNDSGLSNSEVYLKNFQNEAISIIDQLNEKEQGVTFFAMSDGQPVNRVSAEELERLAQAITDNSGYLRSDQFEPWDWRLYVLGDESVVDTQLKRALSTIAAFAFLILVLASVVLRYLLERLISQPLESLIEVSSGIAKGEVGGYRAVDPNFSEDLIRLSNALQDTGERVNREYERAEKTIRELERKNAEQAHLFAIIGHELRTPAAAIKMLEEEQNLESVEPHGREICDLTDHLISVLGDLRSAVRPDGAEFKTRKDDRPYEAVDRALLSIRPMLREGKIDLHFNGDTDSHLLMNGHFQGLRQIVTNLCKNASLHSHANDVWVTLAAHPGSKRNQMEIQLCVEDNGIGIDDVTASRLFEAFYRGKTTQDGTGLGLHLSRDIAQSAGGDIQYERRPGGGSRFVATLLMELVKDNEVTHESSSLSLHANPLQGLKVLVAEDNATIRNITEMTLAKMGADVTSAEDGLIALSYFRNEPFDLLITDIFMPEMDGYQLVEAIRESGSLIPIVGVTAATVGDEVERLLRTGADATLEKPLSKAKLLSVLSKLIDSPA